MVSRKVKDKNNVALPTTSMSNISKLKDSTLYPSHIHGFGFMKFFLEASWGSQTVQHLYIPCTNVFLLYVTFKSARIHYCP